MAVYRPISKRRQFSNIASDLKTEEENLDEGLDYIEEADITGFAYTPEEHSFYLKDPPIEGKLRNALNINGISKTGYDDGRDGYYQHIPLTHINTQPLTQPVSTSQGNQTKDIGLKDITDIALTTLAFLSFGMFFLQVLMCIAMV